jgi:Predicted ATPase (AAA+ superfamily)
MLFDQGPKERKEDMYDYQEELGKLIEALRMDKLIVIKGLRRTGKTSLMRVGLKESGFPYLHIDPRFSENPNMGDFGRIMRDSLELFLRRHGGKLRELRRALSSVRGLKVSQSGVEIQLKWRGEEAVRFGELIKALEEVGEGQRTPVIIGIDEAQELRRVTWIDFRRVIAYSYDNHKWVKFLLTGSEVGVLYNFLRIEDPNSPLFGRARSEVSTRKLSVKESIDFLTRGALEAGIRPDLKKLREAAEELGGIIGWLSYFGSSLVRGESEVETILRSAVALTMEELKGFLRERRSNRYPALLKILSQPRGWAEAKRRLEDVEGGTLNDRTLLELLSNLVSVGLVEKMEGKYVIADPIVRRAVELL